MLTGPHDSEELALMLMRNTWAFGHALEHGACEQNVLAFEQLDEACNRVFLVSSEIFASSFGPSRGASLVSSFFGGVVSAQSALSMSRLWEVSATDFYCASVGLVLAQARRWPCRWSLFRLVSGLV